MIARRFVTAACVAFVAVACGGAAKEAAAPPASPAHDPPAPPPPADAASASTTPATASAPATPGAGGAPAPVAPGATSGAASRREAAIQQARGEIDRAVRELDVSAGDCRAACRALASMDRAAGHLCSLTTQEQTERDGRCDDAKRSVFRAREKVKTTCGSCPGGPSVDKNAPVPSTPD
jgi:hypothetical protein